MIGEVRLPAKAKVIVVGGGIQGLSVAYNLARLGERDVVVLDAGYFQGGASGRNGTLIRGGFMSDAWTALFALSNRRWIELSKRLQRNVMFSRRGYLLVAERPETAARFEPALLMHAKHGVQSKRLSSRELYRIAPALNRNAGLEAIFLPEGGVSPHHAAMHGYLEACHELGVRVHYGTPITHITAPRTPRPTPATASKKTSPFWPRVASQLAFMASMARFQASFFVTELWATTASAI